MRTVIFDLDGTLADTSLDLLNAANVCFRDLGHGDVLSPDTDRPVAVCGAIAMLRLGFERLGRTDTDLIPQLYPRLLQAYAADISAHTVFYDGALECVAALRDAGFVVGICTNKPQDLARQLLHEMNVTDRFDSLIGGNTLPVSKPDPAPYFACVSAAKGNAARSMMIGDTITDVMTAKNAGVPSVVVTFGPAGDDVRNLPADYFINSFAKLPALAMQTLT